MNTLALIAVVLRRSQPQWVPPWAMFLGMAALAVITFYLVAQQQRKRREALTQFALENGFLYSEQPDAAAAEELAQIQIKSGGLQQRARFRNLMRGSASGLDTFIVDRTVGSGKSSSTSTIVAFRFSAAFPEFMLCGENVLWHIAEKLGYSDIDIDGAPDFSERFFLHGNDPAAIRVLFKPQVTQAFEQLNKDKPPYVTASGPWLVTHYPGRTIPPSQLREFLQQAQQVAEAFKRAQTSSAFR